MTKLYATCAMVGFFSLLAVLVRPSSSSTNTPADVQIHPASTTGRAFEIPYTLTETNHLLVRVRINGKGPFNFLVDSGAPALYIATELASKAGLRPSTEQFWTPVNRLELEGGAVLTGVKARVEDPFQLVGMNALGLPGTTIDGILGFTILARFRLQIDPTRDYMVWTLLNYVPPDPPVARQMLSKGQQHPRELQALSALGPLAKGLAFLIGKQPEERRFLHGLLGFQWSETQSADGRSQIVVSVVLKGSPADQAGLSAGDRVLSINSQPVSRLRSAQVALAATRPGDSVRLSLERKVKGTSEIQRLAISLTAAEGF